MGKINGLNINDINNQLPKKSFSEIIKWALSVSKRPVLTTNFRPYESAILHAVTEIKKDIPVIWCDTGYNTKKTYKFAAKLVRKLKLNIKLYVPNQTVAYREVFLGLPSLNDPNHKIFTNQVKLEPFKRAMKEHNPDLWFTNLRKGQTKFRNSIDIVSEGQEGVLKVSPFYNYSDSELDEYIIKNNLPNEFNYYDPTKLLNNRECGLHYK